MNQIQICHLVLSEGHPPTPVCSHLENKVWGDLLRVRLTDCCRFIMKYLFNLWADVKKQPLGSIITSHYGVIRWVQGPRSIINYGLPSSTVVEGRGEITPIIIFLTFYFQSLWWCYRLRSEQTRKIMMKLYCDKTYN